MIERRVLLLAKLADYAAGSSAGCKNEVFDMLYFYLRHALKSYREAAVLGNLVHQNMYFFRPQSIAFKLRSRSALWLRDK